jgi:predicted nuclease with RNAse H fold
MTSRHVPTICVGIDLAGVAHRETGLALLRDGHLEQLETGGDDAEILHFVAEAGISAVVAINAPLTRPRGRCCLDDDCPCRTDPGTRSRQLERELGRMKVPTLATALIKVLARRGERIAGLLRGAGWSPIEVYPFATLKLLGLSCSAKRTELGRRRINRALRPIVPGLRHPKASEHELDAVVCALTADLWRRGLARTVGDPEEGLMVIPSDGAAPVSSRSGKSRTVRVAGVGAGGGAPRSGR